MSPRPTKPFGSIDYDYATVLATTPPEDDGPIWMVNLMAYKDQADYGDGSDAAISGKEADDRYAPTDVLADLGAEVVFFGDVESQLLGDTPKWDRIGVVKYPTRRSFIEMQSRPDFKEKYVHKEAGMRETIICGAHPFEAPALPDDAPDWADVPHPPTEEDGPIMVIHVLKFHEGGAEGDMTTYQDAAGQIAVPLGVRLAGWFGVEGTIIGDGRTWDQIRFNAFPSKAAFMAVVLDPARLEAQRGHREVAIEDTYTFIVRPQIDRIAASIEA